MSKISTASIPRKQNQCLPIRSPPDHQLSSSNSHIQKSLSYEGDSEEETVDEIPRHERFLTSESKGCSPLSRPQSDCFLAHGHLPHSQHTRVMKSLTSNNSVRHHRYSWSDSDKVTLLVDGKRFIINPNLLIKHPNTMLGR